MNQPPLLLLHGALGSRQQLEPLDNALTTHYAIHRLDFSGHGGKVFKEDPFSIALFAEEVAQYLKHQELSQIDIFGYSMGGYVALYLALTQPVLVNRIFTLATKFDWTPETAGEEVKMLNPAVIELKVPHFAETLAERHAPQDWKVNMSKTAEMMLHLGEQAAIDPAEWAKIKSKVLVTVGTADKMVSQQESKQVAEAIPHASFHAFEGMQHPIENVAINTLTDKMKSFFK